MRGIVLGLVIAGACGGTRRDSGDADARASIDSGEGGDARSIDAAPAAWTGLPAIACDDASDAPYAAAAGGAAGSILACAPVATWDLAAAQSRVPAGVAAATGVSVWRIAFATKHASGAPAVSTALVYLPQAPAALPVPRVVIGHPSVGLADACAPSRNPDDVSGGLDALALPFASRGYAVIAPDLSGLGNDGVQAYLDSREQGGQLLDGARALRAIAPCGTTADSILLAGWSQGGGAVISAQALASSSADAGHVVGTIAFAPEWPERIGSFGYEALLRNPDELTIVAGLSAPSVAVLRQYAWGEAALGAGHGVDLFPTDVRADVEGALGSQCLIALGGWIEARMTTAGALVDPALRDGVIACLDGGASSPGCTGTAAAYAAFLTAPRLSGAPDEGPIFIVQGSGDAIMPAASEAACDADALRADGVTVETCVDPLADHLTIVGNQMATAEAWGEAAIAGGSRPACATTTLPACQP